VFRDADGVARVAANQCPHRGAPLAMGTVVGRAIQCPYHGWQWDGELGHCLHIPALGRNGAIPPAARLRTFAAFEEYGLVWTTLSGDPLGEPPHFAELDDLQWGSDWLGDPAFDVDMNVCGAIENFRDVAHFPFVHEKTMGILPHEVPPLDTRRDGLHAYMRRVAQRGADETMDARWDTMLAGEVKIAYHAIAPASVSLTTESPLGKRVLLFAVAPTTLQRSRWYLMERLTAGFPIPIEESLALGRAITEEDVAIVEHVRPAGFESLRQQVHCLADAYTLKYREAFMAFVEQALAR
jgi:phenylpropionate dioxygenase-like ring-hydroxylating dioxygenase large terminal subunit